MDSKELMAGKLVAHMLENDIRALCTENAALKEQVAHLQILERQLAEKIAAMQSITAALDKHCDSPVQETQEALGSSQQEKNVGVNGDAAKSY